MKSSESSLPEERRRHTQAIVETHLAAVFDRIPMLCGFTVQGDLEVGDVAVFTWPGYSAGNGLYEDLMQALLELVEERPDAIELLRGRTFARAFH